VLVLPFWPVTDVRRPRESYANVDVVESGEAIFASRDMADANPFTIKIYRYRALSRQEVRLCSSMTAC